MVRRRPLAAGVGLAFAIAAGACSDAPPPSLADGVTVVDPAGLRYTCGVFPFEMGILAAPPGNAEQAPGPAAAALRAKLAEGDAEGYTPPTGWHLAGQDDFLAEFVALGGPLGLIDVTVENVAGNWEVTGWGDCPARLVLPDGVSAAVWSFDPAQPPPDATTQVLDAMVTEVACSGKPAAGRVVGPQLAFGPDVILVIFMIQGRGGAQACPGNDPTRVRVDLGAPLGDRSVRDGGRLPPGDPAIPRS